MSELHGEDAQLAGLQDAADAARERESAAFYKQQFNHERTEVKRLAEIVKELSAPIPMILFCPACRVPHVDDGEWATRPHHTHKCTACSHEWTPAVRATVGVQTL